MYNRTETGVKNGVRIVDAGQIAQLLDDYGNGRIGEASAVERLRRLPFEDLDFAGAGHFGAPHGGFPEVICCPGKSPEQITDMTRALLEGNPCGLIAVRASREAFEAVRAAAEDAEYHEGARLVTVRRGLAGALSDRPVLVVSAGTADLPVAEESALVADLLGCVVERVYDVGAAGLHRLLSRGETLRSAGAVIVVAGMEGALASVLEGLVRCPVVAVPASSGCDASSGGLPALLAMLNSCAAGVAVCNIDNGFGAAWMASRIVRTALKN